MKFDINNAEAERQKTLKFAKDNNISDDEVNSVYNEIYSQLPDDLSDSAKELRALRKTRGSLRRIANSNANYVDGFIVARFRNSDYNVNAWNKVDEYIAKHGKEDAKDKGMIDDEGNYLHTSLTTNFSNQMGKKIDKDDIRGNAIALFKGEDDNIDMRFLSIGKFCVNDTIPICREVSMNIKKADNPGKLFPKKNQFFLNHVRYTTMSHYYSAEDFQSYANMIEEECGDIFFSSKTEIDDYANDEQGNAFNLAAAFCTVNRIGTPLDNGSVPIELELDDELITTWAEKYIFKDLVIEEGIVGLAFINTYIGKEDKIGYRICGFLPLADE